jgi:adenine-specific DNA-methyltransferase
MPTLNWLGKDKVIRHHHDVPFRVLVHRYGFGEKSGSVLVKGDNLHALKALLPQYEGRVKCVYIDPPYNTGNESWVYNDNVNDPKIKKWLGEVVGKEGEDLSRHDKWLCMMYPRLCLLQRLLAEDGIILISIDDNEYANLKLICDEIFGNQNFVANVIWEKGRKNDARLFSIGHEYIAVYAKNKSFFTTNNIYWREDKPGAHEIFVEYQRLREIYKDNFLEMEKMLKNFYAQLPKNHPAKKHSRYNKVDANGVWRDDNLSWPGGNGPEYNVIHPVTKQPCKIPTGGWRFSTPERMQEMIDSGVVIFRKDHTEPPIRKAYLVRKSGRFSDDDEGIGKQVMGSYFYRSAIQATNMFSEIFGKRVFDNPKDTEVIQRIISYVTNNDANAIILDSFAGSGTTAHAVLNLNKADGGNRKFILIEYEDYAETITAERIRRVIIGYGDKPGTGGGFSFYELGEPLLLENGNLNTTIPPEKIYEYVWYSETKTAYMPQEAPYYLGKHMGCAYYFYYNPKKVTVLDTAFLTVPKTKAERYVIYADVCGLSEADMNRFNIKFKKIPRDISKLLEG